MDSTNNRIEKMIDALKAAFNAKSKILIAFSGGVDSAVVAKIAHDSLGKNAVAVTIASETFPKMELKIAKKVAKEIGIRHKIIEFKELENTEFTRNPPNRCYYCRKAYCKVLKEYAQSEGIDTIADGINISDFNEHRPGIKAANEAGIWHPLVEFNISKTTVRRIARKLNLSVYNKPSMACMASRIPYGETISLEKIRKVERAEEYLKQIGFKQVRVRNHNNIARIEVPVEEMPKFFNTKFMINVCRKLRKIGFSYVTLDLQGYRSGSMDEVLV